VSEQTKSPLQESKMPHGRISSQVIPRTPPYVQDSGSPFQLRIRSTGWTICFFLFSNMASWTIFLITKTYIGTNLKKFHRIHFIARTIIIIMPFRPMETLVILSLLVTLSTAASETVEHGEHHAPPADAILFPVFILGISAFFHFFLSRYLPQMPYTATCFLIGCVFLLCGMQ